MQQRRSRATRGHTTTGALLSLLVHAALIVPLLLMAWVYGGREEAQRAEEVDVAFQDIPIEELPADLPPIEPPPPTPETTKPRPKPDRKKPPKSQLAENKKKETKPEPEVVVPPLPPMPEPPAPPPPPPEHHEHQKMVDLDNDKEVEPPPDAKYLAEKNNRAEVETRARDTNLEKAQKGEAEASAPSKRHDEQVGGEDQKIAQLEEQHSKEGRKAPQVTPHANPEVARTPEPAPDKSLLSLRDPAPRRHELTPETADLSLPRTPDGDVAMPRQPVRGDKSDPAQGKTTRPKLALTGKDYEYLFGADAEAERRLAQKQRSTKAGKFQQRLARTKAALENFIPEVQPGNQTALNTRAAPFASYITRMHRSIHEKWGFGQIVEWDEKPSTSPYNNPDLLTTLELVLNGDGTIDNVKVIRTSGLTEYDVAALDVAYSAGPYPDPPRAIRSSNGKIYIHWDFHRDGRQCSTEGVSYFILNNPPKDADKPAVAEPPPTAPSGPSGPSAPQVPHTLGPAGGEERSLRHLTRGDGATQPGAGSIQPLGGARVVSPSGIGAAAEQREAPQAAPRAVPRADDSGARAVAEKWFAALAGADVNAMADLAAFPFRTTTGTDVKTRGVLVPMLRDLAAEAPRPPLSLQVLTKAGARGVLGGRLPPGVPDDATILLAVADLGGHDTMVLVLGQRPGGIWKAVGLLRR
jgi:hypothetical protein